MRNVRLWRGLLAVDQRTVIEEIEFEEFEEHDAERGHTRGGSGASAQWAVPALWPLRAAGTVVRPR